VRARATIAVAAGTAAILAGFAPAAGASQAAAGGRAVSAAAAPLVHINGKAKYPAAYTATQLAKKYTQTTFTVADGKQRYTDTGVALSTIVSKAVPKYPSTITTTLNEQLRVTVTVTGGHGYQVTFALGELMKGYGNHPAYLALTQDKKPIAGGPELVVPGDSSTARWIHGVQDVTIGVATGAPTDTKPAAGSPVEVIDGNHTVTVTAAQIARLPAETLHMSISAMHGMEKKTETGPSLLAVLNLAGVKPGPDTWINAVGDDDYAAAVTPDEQLVGGRKLQLSQVEDGTRLPRPRLVPYGDFYADRFVYDVVDLYVGTGPAD
jgi:hypothetical protein